MCEEEAIAVLCDCGILCLYVYVNRLHTPCTGAASVDEDDDDLWSDYKDLKGALNVSKHIVCCMHVHAHSYVIHAHPSPT